MGALTPFDKAGSRPPMPQQPRTDEADDQDYAGTDQRRHGDAEMAEGKAVIDRPDRLAGKERRGMHRQRGAARGLRQVGDVNLDAIVQHVEAEPEQHEHRGLDVPSHVQRNQDESDRSESSAGEHQLPLGHPHHQERQRQRQDNAAEAERGDDEARIGGMGFAAGEQQKRHIGKHAVDDDALEEHRAEADFCPRIGEHAAKPRRHGGEIERPRLRRAQTAKCEKGDHRDDRAETADREEHAAPAEQIADPAGDHGANEVSGQADRQEAPDRDLPRVERHKIADDGDADREDAAGADAGDDAHGHQQREIAGEGADQRRRHHGGETDVHQPGLAEEIADGAERRLHEGVGKRERARQQRRGFHVDGEIGGNLRNHRIDGAREQRRGENHQADDSEDGGNEKALCPSS
jgi:hypothetical protein